MVRIERTECECVDPIVHNVTSRVPENNLAGCYHFSLKMCVGLTVIAYRSFASQIHTRHSSPFD